MILLSILDSDKINDVITDPSTNDILDIAIQQALPELFKKGSYNIQTKSFIAALEHTLSAANMTLITERDNANFTSLCSVGVFLCIRGDCHCSGDSKEKRDFISDNEVPFTKECPKDITRVCYHGKCYCQLYQNINAKRQTMEPLVIIGGSKEISLASKLGYSNLWLCLFLIILVLSSIYGNNYFH